VTVRATTFTPTRQRFGQIVARDETHLDLAEAALLIAAEEYPDLNVGRYLMRLDEMGARAREAVPAQEPLAVRLSALNRYLFTQEGFRGNSAEYYDPRNSFLNDVLDRKMGIPISLSAVYIEVGRRSGLQLEGVGFPGHFLVKARDEDGEIVADPFHGGKLLSARDCQKRLDRVYGGKVKLEASMLEAVGPRQMLLRMLRNLKAIYVRGEDHLRALKVLELLLLLEADNAEDLRDRGLVYAALDCYGAAAADLEAYLQQQPRAPEADKIMLKIADLKRRAARLH
jgi:regulator of sirC expression with transglutaminase-like and TPR domain